MSATLEIGRCRELRGAAGKLYQAKHMRGMNRFEFVPKWCPDYGRNDICFYLCVARCILGPSAKKKRWDKFFTEQLKTEGIRTPVALHDIELFKSMNEHLDLSTNVMYQDEEGAIFPAYVSKRLSAKRQVLLMLFHSAEDDGERALFEGLSEDYEYEMGIYSDLPNRRNGEGNFDSDPVPHLSCSMSSNAHYAFVPKASAVLVKRKRARNNSEKEQAKYSPVCFNCCTSYKSSEVLANHVKW